MQNEVLEKVVARLDRGWKQGDLGRYLHEEGDVCLAGAFKYVAAKSNWSETAPESSMPKEWRQLQHWAEKTYATHPMKWDPRSDPVEFNDMEGNSLEDIKLYLKEFDTFLEERHAQQDVAEGS